MLSYASDSEHEKAVPATKEVTEDGCEDVSSEEESEAI